MFEDNRLLTLPREARIDPVVRADSACTLAAVRDPGVALALWARRLAVMLDDGCEVSFDLKDYAALDHGYASTRRLGWQIAHVWRGRSPDGLPCATPRRGTPSNLVRRVGPQCGGNCSVGLVP